MKQGDVVLTPVPQSNGITKNRPAIFLKAMPPYEDLLVCGVSTQLYQEVATKKHKRHRVSYCASCASLWLD